MRNVLENVSLICCFNILAQTRQVTLSIHTITETRQRIITESLKNLNKRKKTPHIAWIHPPRVYQNTKISNMCLRLPQPTTHPWTCRRNTPLHRGKVAAAAAAAVWTYARVWVQGSEKKRVTHGTYARQCMLALLPFLAPPPHLPRALVQRDPLCIMEARHASRRRRRRRRRAIYPLLFAFAGRQRGERRESTTVLVLARSQPDRQNSLLSIYNGHYDRVRRPSLMRAPARSTVCLSHT